MNYDEQNFVKPNPNGMFILPIIALVGIYGFYLKIYILTYIAGVIMALGIPVKGFTRIIAAIIGWLIVEDFWLGVSIGMCVEEIVATMGGFIMLKLLQNNK